MLMSEDCVPLHLTQEDAWGARIMARREDGWCAALDRVSLRCGIYDRRPTVCREYEMGGSDCLSGRSENLI
jgi:Fe-S-cluster containining protein